MRLGSDCTGYNSAGLALEALHVKYKSVFASDIDAQVRRVIKENFADLKNGKKST